MASAAESNRPSSSRPVTAGALAGIPLARMGSRLAALRRTRRLSVRHVARRTGISRSTLRDAERGRAPIDDAGLQHLLALYNVTLGELLPERRSRAVTVQAGTVSAGGRVRTVGPSQPSNDDVLAGYLEMIYQLRNVKIGARIALRDDDLDGLADALGRDPATLESRLVELMRCSPEVAVELRTLILGRRVLAPAAGLVLGVSALAGSGAVAPALAAGAAPPPVERASPHGPEALPSPPAPGVEIGTAIVVERGADGRIAERSRDGSRPR